MWLKCNIHWTGIYMYLLSNFYVYLGQTYVFSKLNENIPTSKFKSGFALPEKM